MKGFVKKKCKGILTTSEYQIRERLDGFMGNGRIMSVITNAHFVVLPDEAELPEIYGAIRNPFCPIHKKVMVQPAPFAKRNVGES